MVMDDFNVTALGLTLARNVVGNSLGVVTNWLRSVRATFSATLRV